MSPVYLQDTEQGVVKGRRTTANCDGCHMFIFNTLLSINVHYFQKQAIRSHLVETENEQIQEYYFRNTICGTFLQLLWCPLVATDSQFKNRWLEQQRTVFYSRCASDLRCRYWSWEGFVIWVISKLRTVASQGKSTQGGNNLDAPCAGVLKLPCNKSICFDFILPYTL